MKNLLTLFVILLINIDAYSQCQSRYQNEIFSSTNKLTINYSDVYNDNAHKMDVYSGDGDTATKRPLIIFIMEDHTIKVVKKILALLIFVLLLLKEDMSLYLLIID